MSLRLKLFLSYLVMGFIPIILLVCVTVGILVNVFNSSPFLSSLENNHEKLLGSVDDLLNIEILDRENPEGLFDKSMLSNLDSELNAFHVGILLTDSGGRVFYASEMLNRDALLPAIDSAMKNETRRSPQPADARSGLLGYEKLDIGSVYSVFYKELNKGLGTFYLAFETGKGKQLTDAAGRRYLGVIFWGMAGLIVLLTFLVTRSMMQSLRKLREGVRHIAEGDLGFSIKTNKRDEVAQVVMAFEEMRLRLKASIDDQIRNDENRKELVANISHDLKTPVTAIKGYVEGLMDGVADTPEKREKYLSTILGKTVALDRMIDDLFLYSSLDTGRANYHFEVLRATEVFEGLCSETKLDLAERGFEVSCGLRIPTDVMIRVDRQMVQRLQRNLAENAAKYGRESGRKAVLTAEMHNNSIVCAIEDNGRGISEADMPHIFERFYRADAARTSTVGGTGLGLQICRRIIEDHGGRIWAESEYGSYTRISWTLPVLSPGHGPSGNPDGRRSAETEPGGGNHV